MNIHNAFLFALYTLINTYRILSVCLRSMLTRNILLSDLKPLLNLFVCFHSCKTFQNFSKLAGVTMTL